MFRSDEIETEEYLERLGLGEPRPEGIDTPQVWPDEQLNNLHGLRHLDRWVNLPQYPQPGMFLNTECNMEELLNYLKYLHTIGAIRNFSIDSEQPIESIDIMGNRHYYPQGHVRRTITIEYDSGNKVEWDIEHHTPGNVRMIMISWELGWGRERDGVQLVGF